MNHIYIFSNMHVEHMTHHLVMDLKVSTLNMDHPDDTFGHAEIKHNVMTAKFYRKVYGRNLDLGIIQPIITETKLLLSFDTRSDSDSETPHLTGVCSSQDEQIYVSDQANGSLKVYNHKGKLVTIYKQGHEYKLNKPYDVTILNNGHLAITDVGSKNVVILTPEGHHVSTASSYVTSPRGVVGTTNNNLLVLESYKPEIKLFSSKNGERIRAVYSNQNENDPNILKDPYYVALSPDGNIIISDGHAPFVHVFARNGKVMKPPHVIYSEGEHQLIQTRGICVDKYGYILLADQQSDCVQILTPTRQFIRFVVTSENGVHQPIAVAINKQGHLIVTEKSGYVKIFQYN